MFPILFISLIIVAWVLPFIRFFLTCILFLGLTGMALRSMGLMN